MQMDRRDAAEEVTPTVVELNDFVTTYARYVTLHPGGACACDDG